MGFLNNKLKLPLVLVGATCCMAATSPDKALAITANDQGWYSTNLPHDPTNTTYIVGAYNGGQVRNFFVFNLPNSPISSAFFTVDTKVVSANNQNVSLFGFNGSIADLVSGTSSYSVLGQGQSFGSLIYNVRDTAGAKTFTLNSAGVSYLNSLVGGQAAITGDNPGGGYVYGASFFTFATLTLNEALPPAQSVPGPLPIFGTAAAFQASRRLKNRIRQSSLSKTNGNNLLDRVGIDA